MKCKYCNQEYEDSSKKYGSINCPSCNVSFHLKDNILSSIAFTREINGYEYIIELSYGQNVTFFIKLLPDDKTWDTGLTYKTLFKIEGIIPGITPDNVLARMKKFLILQ